ncbi:Flavin-binding monooxygenase-like protein [Ancylostoma ceylanicum]|uniref:Flavin-containing monooxygenase n=1 Tax=Ancylostoma ceylanicum TaxID=53326 RepID=A0A0D6LEK8_9BILA|nr:Flavin-binding monooxygenase-like protein [Ancylostoma ceylanicum]
MATTVVNTSKEMMAYSDFPPPEDWPNFMHHSKVHIEKFKGRIMHAYDFRDTKGFEGKNVFLLGIGNSALDIAVDLAKIAKSVSSLARNLVRVVNSRKFQVTISTRRGTWIFNKVAAGGMPYDTIYMTRFFQQHPTVNDSLCNLICTGYITIADDVDTFTADKVIVKNGRSYDCDVFITCTGYTFGFPYVDKKIINIEVCKARWVIQVFLGKLPLPSKQAMLDDIAEKRAKMKRRYFQSEKHTIQVDYVKYMDEIASILGCKPDLFKVISHKFGPNRRSF